MPRYGLRDGRSSGAGALEQADRVVLVVAVTIEDVYEPYLLQIGYLNRTPRGRCITAAACDHIGVPYGRGTQIMLDL